MLVLVFFGTIIVLILVLAGTVWVSRRVGRRCVKIYELGPKPPMRSGAFYPGRSCCPTPPDTAHTGMCKNSLMRSGEEQLLTNE